MREQKYRTSNLCEAMCGMVVTLDDGAITDIRGDRDDVLSRGHICPKGPAMRDLLDDPDRLRHPVRRTATGWEQIGWDEALSEVATRLGALGAQHGRDAVGIYVGNPVGHNHGAMLMGYLLGMALGTRNRFDANSQDANPLLMANLQMHGDLTAITVPDLDRTSFFLILGANPAASNGSVMSLGDVRGRLEGVRARGGRMVLIDPRRTETAKLCDEHHFIRPGGDAALLLAMIHTIFTEGLCDERAVAEVARGIDPLRALAARFPPERVAEAIGIDAATIHGLARDFARAPSAVAYGRVGICHNEFSSIASWLVEALNVVTGNFDRPGGAMFPSPAIELSGIARLLDVGHHGRHCSRVRGLPDLGGMLPAATMAEEMETPGEGQIRGLITLAGNPALSVPGGGRLVKALSGLEFMVSVDFYINETTRHAHLILPPRQALERGHYDLLMHALAVRNTVKWSEPVVAPAPDTREDWDILYELSLRLAGLRGGKLGEKASLLALRFGRIGSEGLLDLLLRMGPYGDRFLPFSRGLTLEKVKRAPHGIDLGPLVPGRKRRVRTPGNRVELAPPLFLADANRLDAWIDAGRGTDLLLIGRRHVRSNNSWMHNLRSLVKGPDRSGLLMHPLDAARLGIESGVDVKITGRTGAVTAKVAVTDTVVPGVVSLPHGFGHGAAATTLRVAGALAGANANEITDENRLEPLTGSAILTGVPVTVERVLPS
jgi:anaerobic selenocysteine-containing dehydrogenase